MERLTPCEAAVVTMLATTGKSSEALAKALFRSVKTIDNHLFNASRKLGVRGRLELVVWYYTARVGSGTP